MPAVWNETDPEHQELFVTCFQDDLRGMKYILFFGLMRLDGGQSLESGAGLVSNGLQLTAPLHQPTARK